MELKNIHDYLINSVIEINDSVSLDLIKEIAIDNGFEFASRVNPGKTIRSILFCDNNLLYHSFVSINMFSTKYKIITIQDILKKLNYNDNQTIVRKEHKFYSLVNLYSNKVLSEVMLHNIERIRICFSQEMNIALQKYPKNQGLIHTLRSCELRKGYAYKLLKEVIIQCEYRELYSCVKYDNIASLSLHEKLGFKIIEEINNDFFILKYEKIFN